MSILENPQVVALLTVQAQAISRSQLLELGVSEREIDGARGRDVDVASRGVYVGRGSTPSWRQELWVARLALPSWAAVSHEAAAADQVFGSFRPGPVVFRVPHGTRVVRPGIVVHQTRDPWAIHVEVKNGLLVTTPAQTICDLAATTRFARLRDAVDDAFARKVLQPAELIEVFDELRRQGKPGFKMLARILDDWREGGKLPTQSTLERDTLRLFDRFGGPKPKVAWPYPTREQVPGIADFGYGDALLALETDGRKWHDRISQAKRDKERDANAARPGVEVLRILWEHVHGDPKGTWELIMDTRAIRLKQLGRDGRPGTSGVG